MAERRTSPARPLRRQPSFKEEPFSWLDIGLMGVQTFVSISLLVNMVYIFNMKEESIYGSFPSTAYDWNIDEAKHLMLRTSIASGAYVLLANVIGSLGRFFRIAPFYGLYYCSNVFGISVCLITCVWPVYTVAGSDSYCIVAEDSCTIVDDLAACPYPHATSSMHMLPPTSAAVSGVMEQNGEGLLRWLAVAATPLPCCYFKEFETFCSEMIGAYYTQSIIAAVLAALLMAQGCVACCVICCNADIEWSMGPISGIGSRRKSIRLPTTSPGALEEGENDTRIGEEGGGGSHEHVLINGDVTTIEDGGGRDIG